MLQNCIGLHRSRVTSIVEGNEVGDGNATVQNASTHKDIESCSQSQFGSLVQQRHYLMIGVDCLPHYISALQRFDKHVKGLVAFWEAPLVSLDRCAQICINSIKNRAQF